MKRAIGTIAVLAALTPIADAADPQELAESKQCFSCHSLDKERQAPSFKLLARNYRGIRNADLMLERKVQLGGLGHWGAEPMPAAGPRPAVSEAEAKELVAWILSLK
jgi:cytochrome c